MPEFIDEGSLVDSEVAVEAIEAVEIVTAETPNALVLFAGRSATSKIVAPFRASYGEKRFRETLARESIQSRSAQL